MKNNQNLSTRKFENGLTITINWPGEGKPLSDGSLLINKKNGDKILIPLIDLDPALEENSRELA